jgi:DNA-binding NtrC family response regulator
LHSCLCISTWTFGAAAIRKVKEWKPKVVLLDMIIPRTEGSDVLKEIRKADPAIGVVIVTVVTDNLKASESFELGAYDSVTKPVDLITRKRRLPQR